MLVPYRSRICIALLVILCLIGCGGSGRSTKVLRVGFVPAEDAQQVMQNAQPIVDILQKELGMEIQPFVAADYTGVVEALRVNKLDVAFLTPASYVLAKNEANVKVVLKSERKGIASYYAAIITRADSGIQKLEDLRGKTFAFGDALSTTGNIFPRKMFKERGIDPVRDFKQILYSGGHDATVLAVLNGKVDAGATYANSPDSDDTAWMRYLKDPEDVKKIRAIAFSEPIPADNLVISGNLDEAIAKRVEEIFLQLSRDPKGKQMMRDLYQIDGFVPATDRDYDSVRQAFDIAGIPLKASLQRKQP
ncbi:MAG TPA: phosphate/phosphite/phosphonate ABC transporter substrate-binding protein [Candidatus Binatia bacterium]|nr:phosphate/phosphite/phosphonate ABC transporter substrate-binding protein [Candidatus Binatia bacterium]HET9295476.1 phosphate/phosphite/phosphonate ABC transporter substrate-binding protein [Candidatus Binatia bacterium]